MEAFLVSTLAVGLTEIGDKTQLLAVLMAARYRKPFVLCLALVLATLANNALGGAVAKLLSLFMRSEALPWTLCICLISLAAWSLNAERYEEKPGARTLPGVFGAALAAFFLAGLGGKAQLATAVLALNSQAFLTTVAGATLGVVLVCLPAMLFGERLLARLPTNTAHWGAAAIYATLAFIAVTRDGAQLWVLKLS